MSSVTVQLLQGGEIEVDLDLITEYGAFSIAKEIPADPRKEFAGKYVAIGKTAYIKIYPSELEMYITPESLERVWKAKQKEK